MHQPLSTLSLGGSWQLTSLDGTHSAPGTVPGCVHTDLLSAGLIPDPWYRDNEKAISWVAGKDWVYERDLELPPSLLERAALVLRFEGLDTLCRVAVNGTDVLAADNMHRTWEVDVKAHLRPGANRLRLIFRSPIPLMREQDARHRLPCWNNYHEDFRGKSYVRKMACAFGWDWGLMAPTAGIWRPACLLAYEARIQHVAICQHHDPDGGVRLSCRADVEGDGQVEHILMLEGQPVASALADAEGGAVLSVPDPRLWWPNGMGAQPLYQLETRLLAEDGTVLHAVRRQIGLRTCELIREPDAFGESFRFRINGRDTFMKGGNWIPCDIFPSRVSADTYRDLLGSCALAGMNMIRVWGGGLYEDERFYDACDALGLLVWQDFLFACATYPTFDPAFMENVAAEARDNVRRLHHRASLALWCGNNELEQGLVNFATDEWTEGAMPLRLYTPLFDELLPSIVAAEDGSTPYWPSSGHTPGPNRAKANDPTCGDAHSWSVWFGGQEIEAQRNWLFRFMSEFGFQSYPELKTVESFTLPEERTLINWVMDFHQRSGPGNATILKYALGWFREARSFETSLLVSQLIQALCVQVATEHARRIQGRMDGLLYWQINDIWPGATWSSIDVYRRWKALHYFVRRAFAPVMVSLLEDHDRGTVEVHVSNHRPTGFSGLVRWRVTNCAGDVLAESSLPVSVASQSNQAVTTIDCQSLRERGGTDRLPLPLNQARIPLSGDRDILVWALVEEAGIECSRSLASFARPKYWLLRDPGLQVDLHEQDGQIVLWISSTHCAPWTRLSLRDSEVRFSDNFVHVTPGWPLEVSLLSPMEGGLPALREQLQLTPFVDLFAGSPHLEGSHS